MALKTWGSRSFLLNDFEVLHLEIELELIGVFSLHGFSDWFGDEVSLTEYIDHFFLRFVLL